MYVKTVNQQAYSRTKMVSVTQYVHSILLKMFNCYELDNTYSFHCECRALSERARPHTILIGCDI